MQRVRILDPVTPTSSQVASWGAEGRRLSRAAALDRLVAGYVAGTVFTTPLRLRRIFDVPSVEIEACVARLLHGGTQADTAVVGWRLTQPHRVCLHPIAATETVASLDRRPEPARDLWRRSCSGTTNGEGDRVRVIRCRRLSHHEATVVRAGQMWPFDDIWLSDHLRAFVQPRWRPAGDTYETATMIEIVVELAGVEEDDFEVRLFEDAVVVAGLRRLPTGPEGAMYHAVGIRQGPFQLELALPVPVDPDGVEASYDRGLLRITLPKRTGTP